MIIQATTCTYTHTHTHTHTHTQHSLDDMLNLGAFSCSDDVLVQYKAVNKYGVSRKWSPATEIDVYGGKEGKRERERERERERMLYLFLHSHRFCSCTLSTCS